MRSPWLSIALVSCTGVVDGGAPEPRTLVINEVAAAGDPDDWFEVVNGGDTAIELSDYTFVDRRDDFSRARRFPEARLAPGDRHVQRVVREEHGFALGASDALLLYGFDDRRMIDHVAWRTGASPAGASYARVPDVTGGFVTTRRSTRGTANAQ